MTGFDDLHNALAVGRNNVGQMELTATDVNLYATRIRNATATVNNALDAIDRAASALAKATADLKAAVTKASKALKAAKGRDSYQVTVLARNTKAAQALLTNPKAAAFDMASYARTLTTWTGYVADETKRIADQKAAAKKQAAKERKKAVTTYKKVYAKAQAAVKKAKGKVGSADLRKAMKKAKKTVAKTSSKAASITTVTNTVRNQTAMVNADIKRWKKRQPQYKGWLRHFRLTIDKYAGKHIEIRHDSYAACGSVACGSISTIWLNKSLASKSRAYQNWVIFHEIAHVKQFAVGIDKVRAHKKFKFLYRGDIELMANCMAQGMGKTQGVLRLRCSRSG